MVITSPKTSDTNINRPLETYQVVGRILGPVVFALMLAADQSQEFMSPMAWRAAAVGLWMAIWWATEAIPVAVTAFLPILVFAPLGISSLKEAAAPYANPIIYLFLGGFMLALAMQKCNLHRRIALFILNVSGTEGRSLVFGFMATAALLSMWMTNTSTTMMLVPIIISVISVISSSSSGLPEKERRNFEVCLLLGTAFGATIGGVATLVGTPPNALLAGFLEENYGIQIGFARWMMVGLPVTIIMLPLAWVVLTRFVYPVNFHTSEATRTLLANMRREQGSMSKAEARVGILFLLVVFAWMTRPWLGNVLPLDGVSDPGIVMTAALLLFLIPTGSKQGETLMQWPMTRELPWNILVLFGGGLSLAAAVSNTGLAIWLGESLMPLNVYGITALVAATVVFVIFLTELTSNLATTATILPVVAALALQLGHSPIILTVPVALAASCAFMLPVATPPNAIVFGAGRLTIPQMAKAGFVMNIIGIILLSIIAVWLAPLVFPTTG